MLNMCTRYTSILFETVVRFHSYLDRKSDAFLQRYWHLGYINFVGRWLSMSPEGHDFLHRLLHSSIKLYPTVIISELSCKRSSLIYKRRRNTFISSFFTRFWPRFFLNTCLRNWRKSTQNTPAFTTYSS